MTVKCVVGTNIDDAVWDARRIAIKNRCIVEFEFNDTKYRIKEDMSDKELDEMIDKHMHRGDSQILSF